jgi:hypothetical protein
VLGKWAHSVITDFQPNFKRALTDSFHESLMPAVTVVKSIVGMIVDAFRGLIQIPQLLGNISNQWGNLVAGFKAGYQGGFGPTSFQNYHGVNGNVVIHVNGAQNPKATAQAVVSALGKHASVYQNASGGQAGSTSFFTSQTGIPTGGTH